MKRGVCLGVLLIVSCAVAQAQVRIVLPKKRFAANESIHAKVVNSGRKPVTHCLHWFWGAKLPIPVYMQQKHGRRWGTLMNGVDVGSPLRLAEILQAGQSREFSFQLSGGGETRLVLQYWNGERDDGICQPEAKGFKRLRSEVFVVEDPRPAESRKQ